jgi:quaternary ammonium compound-resistance protein SugE
MTPAIGWVLLIASGLIDVAWAYAMKRADGFTDLAWTAISIVLLVSFIGLLSQAVRVLPLGTAYAVWTGIGAVGSVLVGIALFGEGVAPLRLVFLGIVILGILGLKLSA